MRHVYELYRVRVSVGYIHTRSRPVLLLLGPAELSIHTGLPAQTTLARLRELATMLGVSSHNLADFFWTTLYVIARTL